MAALALRRKLPRLDVLVIRSPEIGIIGVGEGSTPLFAHFLHEYLKIPMQQFVRATRPGIKTGTCFHWGPKPRFFFPFGTHMALRLHGLPRPIGYYLENSDGEAASPNSARMQANRPFKLNPDGSLFVDSEFAYHVENDRFAGFLESACRAAGARIMDGTVESVAADDNGISSLRLATGESIGGELFIDCSGFRSLLLGQTLKEPRVDYSSTLFCDRAVVGGWVRPPGLPMTSYTISETMDAGWCWRIDHPDRINRGYVYSSAFISDAAAEHELRTKNPLVGPTRIVKFISGRYERTWVKNVVALGNASGFVEPLEATSLAVLSSRCILLTELLIDADCRLAPALSNLFNQNNASIWDGIRDFLSLHYKFNTRLDTPFWQECRANINMASAQPVVEFYRHVGPSPSHSSLHVTRGAAFDYNSYLAILAGQRAPTHPIEPPTPEQLKIWENWCRKNAAAAAGNATTEQSLAMIAGGQETNR